MIDRARVVDFPWAAEHVKKEKPKLQGTWRAVNGERDGKAISTDMIDAVNFRLRFDGERVTVQMQATKETKATDMEGAYSLKPGMLDLTDAIDGKTMLCVYRWEANKFKLCGSPKERPTDFSTKQGSERMLFVLKRGDGASIAALR